MTRPYRSALYIPASRPRALDKARGLTADAILFDLEDAVLPAEKAEGRQTLTTELAKGGYGSRARIVRINALETEWGEADAIAMANAACDGVLLPKVNGPDDLDRLAALVPDKPLWAMMETPLGILRAADIAAHPCLAGIVMGTNDLAKDLGLRNRADRMPLMQALQISLIAARAYGRVAIDGVYNAFRDDPGRPAPVNHMADPRLLLAAAPDAEKARDIGLVFSEDPPAGGTPVSKVSATWPSSGVSFTWDKATGTFIVGLNGEESRSSEGGPQRAATVVFQSVEQTDSGYGDRYGGRTPFIQTVGEGAAIVLRDGRMWSVTWERPNREEGTRFTLPDGSPMPFAIGQEWIVLLDDSLSPKIT